MWFPEWLRYVLNDCSATEASERVLLQISGMGIQPVCGVVAEGTINFPARDQSLGFMSTLDAFYQNELDRPVELSYIDLEGKAVWLQEYLRYRVNGCNNQEATDRVFQQIRGGAIAPVCADIDIPEADIVWTRDSESGRALFSWTSGRYEGYAVNRGSGCANNVSWRLETWEWGGGTWETRGGQLDNVTGYRSQSVRVGANFTYEGFDLYQTGSYLDGEPDGFWFITTFSWTNVPCSSALRSRQFDIQRKLDGEGAATRVSEPVVGQGASSP